MGVCRIFLYHVRSGILTSCIGSFHERNISISAASRLNRGIMVFQACGQKNHFSHSITIHNFISKYQHMNEMNPKVDFFFDKAKKWQKEYEKLRTIILDCGLTEELKWGCPCYTFENRNIILIHGFKEYCAVLFFKGALLADPESILVQQTENVQSARQVRFTSLAQIVKMERILKSYVYEAI